MRSPSASESIQRSTQPATRAFRRSRGASSRPEVYRRPAAFEQAVRRSGLEWTILRPGGFHSNAYAWAESIRGSRTAAAPFGDVGLPTVDPADIAAFA
ncbi:SDR family oxidoreductase [Planomonospora algeriensis]